MIKSSNQKDKNITDINSSKANLKDSFKNTIEDNLEKKDLDNDDTDAKKTEETLPLDDDTVAHKKKRKRNVESRDAWT
jgi:hypothetical protein